MSEARGPLAAGLAALRHGKLILLLALVTAALGVTAATPLMPTFQEVLAGTLAGDHFIRNQPTAAPTDFFDLVREMFPAFAGAMRAAGWAGLVGVLFQMLIAGGIIAVLGRGPFSFDQLFGPARRNFWHNLKCFLLFAIANLIVLGAWLGGGGALRKRLLEDAPPDAPARSLTFWILAVVGVLLFAALSLLYDFARAARRHAPTIGAFRAFRFARRALSGSWLRALGLWIFWLALGGGAVLALFALTWALPAVSRPAIAFLMLLQFGVLWLRSAVRVAAWGSYIALLEPRARPALSAIARVKLSFDRTPVAAIQQ
jgi:hypothetical protein